jgi:hypothetical protein
VEGGRIEARGDTEVSTVAEDQFQRGRRLNDLMIRDGRQRSRTDMDRQEGGRIGLGRGRGWGGAVSARATRREPGTEAIEPIAEGVDGDAAELAELDVGQSRAAEIGEDRRPGPGVAKLSPGAIWGLSRKRCLGTVESCNEFQRFSGVCRWELSRKCLNSGMFWSGAGGRTRRDKRRSASRLRTDGTW